MKPVRIQRKRTKGWKMPANTVYVGRPSKWGNQVRAQRVPETTAQEAVDWYRMNLEGAWGLDTLHPEELRGKNLACWCPLDLPCHADVLLEIANRKDK
mgnify:CR=1 FL=1